MSSGPRKRHVLHGANASGLLACLFPAVLCYGLPRNYVCFVACARVVLCGVLRGFLCCVWSGDLAVSAETARGGVDAALKESERGTAKRGEDNEKTGTGKRVDGDRD